MKPKVYIAQLLCPDRHCILAVAAECAYASAIRELENSLRDQWETLQAKGVLNPYCGICGSRDLHVETAPTVFATMAEAWPTLKASEAAQAAVAMQIKAQDN